MNTLAVTAISFYQRHISPYKGFRCAHRAYTGGWSCSEFGKRAFARASTSKAIALLKRRLAACRTTYEQIRGHRLAMAAAAGSPTPATSDEADGQEGKRRSRLVDYCDCGGCDVARIDARALGELPSQMCGSGCDIALPCDCSL